MNDDKRMEQMLIELLAEETPSRAPDRLVPETLRALRHVRRWPRWFALMKEPPMRYPSRVLVGSPTVRLITVATLSLMLLLATVGAIVAGASALSADIAPPPFGPARNGSIAYSRDGDIYLANADGGDERAIIIGPGTDVGPWFSHDGTTIAFARESGVDAGGLVVANADGSGERELLESFEWAEFTPSDAELIAIRQVDDELVMSVVEVDTGAVRDLDLDGIEPFWWAYPRPPDGQEIVFVGHPVPGEPATGIYAVGVDGSGLRTVGDISTSDSPRDVPSPTRWSFQDPSFSPDGRTIAFWNWEPEFDPSSEPGDYRPSGPFLHSRDLATGAELPVLLDAGDGTGYTPRFVPDGTGMVFQGNVLTDRGSRVIQLFQGPSDGSREAEPIGPPFGYPSQLWWDLSPDGTKVLVSDMGSSGASIIDLLTGEVSEIQDVGGYAGWQRLGL